MYLVASFPGLPTVQFLIACSVYTKMEWEGLRTFIM